jgi:hypothetical protein
MLLRMTTFARSLLRPLLAAGFIASVVASSVAQAEEEFDVTVTQGKVVVKTKGDWHINVDYPWKVKINGEKVDKSKFALSKTEASVALPKGAAELRGGVCSGEQCRMFEKQIEIP